MKIIYGITKSNFGGAQRYVFDLATEAKSLGHEVSVMCGGDGPLVEKLKERNIKIITLPYLQRDISLVDELRSLHFIFRTLVEENPDVFHTNSSKMGGLGNLAARLAGVRKIIFTSHGWAFNETWRPWWQKALIKLFVWMTICLSHKTICVSKKTREDVLRLPLIESRLPIVYNGIGEFALMDRATARRNLGIHDENILVVGTNSELHPVKGLDIMLDAWQRFTERHEAILVMISDGELREVLEDYAQELGIADKVIFKGYMDNARQYLLGLDIFCMPSRSENLPYSLLEAGIASRPSIATSVGGIPEIIENGISGALVPPEDSETLFSTLMLLSQDKPLRDRLGSALNATVKEKFSLEKMVKETISLY